MLKVSLKQAVLIVFMVSVMAFGANHIQPWQAGGAQQNDVARSAGLASNTYLPLIKNRHPWMNPFGFEPVANLGQNSTLYNRAVNLQSGWVRLNGRISWRALQPVEGGAIQWGLLAGFENELRALKSAFMTPVVIVDDYPHWAVEIARQDGKPTSCGPLQAGKFSAFAQFMRALVARYMTAEFNVHHWELGNEPDVDPDLVDIDSMFGCWGNIDDPTYGGRHYGAMLKVVSPAIKAQDPSAKVWVGGLLLGTPLTTDPAKGHPELFLQGILESGAASSFDVLPYHWYPSYGQATIDYDLAGDAAWQAWGGGTVGKANFLRQIMQQYGVSKPLSLNETGLGCPNDWLVYAWCSPPAGPGPDFYEMQADHLVRSFTRGLSAGIHSFVWYTLDGPGWRYTSLLDNSGNPKPVYTAYQALIAQLRNTSYVGPVSYGTDIEGYAFRLGASQVQVVWARSNQTLSILVPEAKFQALYTRSGAPVSLTPGGGNYQVPLNFSPVYIVRLP